MNGKIIKKTVSKIIFAGLIISIMPMQLFASQQLPVAGLPDLGKKLSDQDLENIVKSIDKRKKLEASIKRLKIVTKTMNSLKNISAVISVGASVAGLAVGTAGTLLGVGILLAAMFSGPLAPAVAVTGVVVSISGLTAMAVLGIAPASLWFLVGGGLDSITLISAINEAKNLEKIEQKYPGILNAEQIRIRNEFNKTLQGPIAKGIITGIRMKNSLKKHVAMVLENHPDFKHPKKTKKYLERSRQAFNLDTSVTTYESLIQTQTAIRDQHKNKLSWGYNRENFKLLNLKLKPKYLAAKQKLNSLKKYIQKVETKYPEVKNTLHSVTKSYMPEANALAQELLKK